MILRQFSVKLKGAEYKKAGVSTASLSYLYKM